MGDTQLLIRAGGNSSVAASWESVRDAEDATGPPAATDDVVLDVDSGALEWDVTTNAYGTLDMTGYAEAADINPAVDVTVDGAATIDGTISINATGELILNGAATWLAPTIIAECAGPVTFGNSVVVTAGADLTTYYTGTWSFEQGAGAFTLTCGGVTLPAVVVDNDGVTSFTATDKLICQSFRLTAGKFDLDGNDLDSYGHLARTGGTFDPLGSVLMQLAGRGNAGDLQVYPGDCEVGNEAGFVSTLVGNAYCNKASFAGTVNPTTTQVISVSAGVAGWWNCTGEIHCGVLVQVTSQSPGRDVVLVDADLRILSLSSHSMTMDGVVNLGTGAFKVYGDGAGTDMTVTMGPTKTITCGTISLGDDTAATTGKGILTVGAQTTFVNLVAGHANNVGNTFTVPAGGVLTCTGAIDTPNITLAFGAGCRIDGGGTLTGLAADPGNLVACSGMVDGLGNHANYDFGAVMGTRSMMGMGR